MNEVIEQNGQRFELVKVDSTTVVRRQLPSHAPVHDAVNSAVEKMQAEVPARRKPGRPRKSED